MTSIIKRGRGRTPGTAEKKRAIGVHMPEAMWLKLRDSAHVNYRSLAQEILLRLVRDLEREGEMKKREKQS